MFAAHRTDKLHILRMHASRISGSGRPLLRMGWAISGSALDNILRPVTARRAVAQPMALILDSMSRREPDDQYGG
ncbi:MAG: hypothetical protein PCALPYG88_3045 [uncultured Paraburkholderia sp.]|nr:MAG: hypothetical protein PCALPYG08_2992 [uncultured Paraburkholderia sp.]CAH2923063.1 MAG: hypothetical protein PCALPYG88_3045 [uncultured Paraburkholderia sp.]